MAEIAVTEHLFIPLADGTRLAARLWLPKDAAERPVPAILEYIPYRKRDGTRARDEPMHGWFAAQGYAAIRVDMRGSGESEGHMADEYLARELEDACETIDWLSRQSWCDGRVATMGLSYAAHTQAALACLAPPALAAMVLETVGTQEYTVEPADFAKRLAESYGDDCAAEVLPYLP